MDLKLKLENDGDELATWILNGMEFREAQKHIINSPSILPAVFLDPRYNVLLTPNQKEAACKHLTELWIRLRSQNMNASGSSNGATNESGVSSAVAAAVNEVQSDRHSNLSELLKSKKRSHLCQIMCGDDEHALQRVD